MPELSWIGKDKVVNHDKELPYRVLKANQKLSVGDKSDHYSNRLQFFTRSDLAEYKHFPRPLPDAFLALDDAHIFVELL